MLKPLIPLTLGLVTTLPLALVPTLRDSTTAVVAAPLVGAAAVEHTVPGLALTLSVNGRKDLREARLVALRVPAGRPASPLLEAGRVKATWTGYLNLDIRSRLHFSVEGRGRIKLSLDDAVALEGEADDLGELKPKRVRLGKGATPLRFEYEAPADGDAWVRLYWKGRLFGPEPLPPSVFTRDAEIPGLADALAVREGRRLVAALRCQKCHAVGDAAVEDGMPELAASGPSLEGAGDRLRQAWLAEWLANPRALRPTARMPDLLHGDTELRDAADIATWLATLRKEEPPRQTASVSPTEGSHLFQELGCIACHTAPSVPPSADERDRLPLSLAPWKFLPGALAGFLREPGRHAPWTRMPDLALTEDEAASLAGFLRDESPAREIAPPPGDAERGRRRAQDLGCAQCHAGTGLETTATAKPLRGLANAVTSNGGCAAEAPVQGLPHYALDDEQRAAIAAVARHGIPSFARRNAAEFAERQIDELRCTACHVYDRREDRWEKYAGEVAHWKRPRGEKEIAQWRPILTWAGDKLLTSWMTRLFEGKINPRLRPWLHARMPAFPARAELLALGIPERHGLPPERPAPVVIDEELVEPGAWLIDRKGFGCTACHGLGDEPPYATFEFKAVNFAHVHERLRSEFYHRWMRDPRRIDKSSRMPTYADDEGYTEFEDVLDGVAEDQFRAMYHFLHSLGKR